MEMDRFLWQALVGANDSPANKLYDGHVCLVSCSRPLQLHHAGVAPWPLPEKTMYGKENG